MSQPTPASGSSMRSLERALAVLRVLEESSASLRLSELARASDLHVATAQRIVNVLMRHDYVRRDGSGYSMGVRPLLNAHAFMLANPLTSIGPVILQELAATTGRTASLSTRVEFAQVLLVRVEGAEPLRYQLPVGEKMPLTLGGARVLAAAMKQDELEALLAASGEIRLANGTELSQVEFVSALETIREQGYAYGVNQRVRGAASVSVPVFGNGGDVVAALQLSGRDEDFGADRVASYVGELVRASQALTRRLRD